MLLLLLLLLILTFSYTLIFAKEVTIWTFILKKKKEKKTNTWRSYALGSMKEHCVKYRRKIFGKPKFPAQSWATRPKLCGNCAFSQNFHVNKLGWPFHDGGRSHIETSPLICSANQWTGFYMVTASVMKGLKYSILCMENI